MPMPTNQNLKQNNANDTDEEQRDTNTRQSKDEVGAVNTNDGYETSDLRTDRIVITPNYVRSKMEIFEGRVEKSRFSYAKSNFVKSGFEGGKVEEYSKMINMKPSVTISESFLARKAIFDANANKETKNNDINNSSFVSVNSETERNGVTGKGVDHLRHEFEKIINSPKKDVINHLKQRSSVDNNTLNKKNAVIDSVEQKVEKTTKDENYGNEELNNRDYLNLDTLLGGLIENKDDESILIQEGVENKTVLSQVERKHREEENEDYRVQNQGENGAISDRNQEEAESEYKQDKNQGETMIKESNEANNETTLIESQEITTTDESYEDNNETTLVESQEVTMTDGSYEVETNLIQKRENEKNKSEYGKNNSEYEKESTLIGYKEDTTIIENEEQTVIDEDEEVILDEYESDEKNEFENKDQKEMFEEEYSKENDGEKLEESEEVLISNEGEMKTETNEAEVIKEQTFETEQNVSIPWYNKGVIGYILCRSCRE